MASRDDKTERAPLALPPASVDSGAEDGASARPSVTPEEGRRNLTMLVLKLGAVFIAMQLLFAGSVVGMGASLLEGTRTAQVEIKHTIYYYSWDELNAISREIASSGSAAQALRTAQRFHLVDEDGMPFGGRRVALSDGTVLTARLAGIYEELPRGRGGLTFFLEGELPPMPMDETIARSWDSTYLRSWLNEEFYNLMAPDLKRSINWVSKPASGDALRLTKDRVWIASVPELTIDVQGDGMGELEFLADDALRGSWLRTSSEDGQGFCYVDEAGEIVSSGEGCDPAVEHRVVPFFIL